MRVERRPPGSPAAKSEPSIVIGLNAAIVAVTRERPRVLTISETDGRASGLDILPHGPLDPRADRTLELALRGWVRERTGIELGYVEQLYTFGDRDRAGDRGAESRLLTEANLALVRERELESTSRARWRDWYTFFPWEDWRAGQPAVISKTIEPALRAWIGAGSSKAARSERTERAGIAFGLSGSDWDGERVLERYELLYEIGLVSESRRSHPARAAGLNETPDLGSPMGMDHRRILATAMGRIRGKLRYRPVVFELLPPTFTLTQLQREVEALAGVRLHKQNFRRLAERGGLVEGTGTFDSRTGGRPAELFRFRREVLRERRAPGVGLPAAR
jgi:hypothetical protein